MNVHLISQGSAYGLLIGLAIAFCIVILFAVRVQRIYLSEDSGKSEMFMVANRTVGTGLTASAVFSSWMWINETVLSAATCYRFGIAVPMWYGSALCFQIALMAVVGVLAKIRVPYAHTSLEIIRMRYGRAAHLVYLGMNLVNNIFGCASMILVGSQLINGVSGMHIVAATILIPVGVVLYTAVGGLKATFLTDFLHTLIALILIIYFTIATLSNDRIGGLYGLYDKVIATASENYIPHNYKGSLLTMKSKESVIWALILSIGNLALVVMDTAFWQKSFATEVKATVPGYNIAALAIFGVPWGLGTVIGLVGRAIHRTPIFPTYPADITESQVEAGFVMPYTLMALLGQQSVIAFFVLVFMALTSTISSSMIAVSSILSFDLYKTYLNPRASDRRLVSVSHLTVVFHAVFMAGFSLALNYGGANMTWISYLRPMISAPGIIPLILSLCWSRQSRAAIIGAPLLGVAVGLSVWLGTSKTMYGAVNMTTTSYQAPSLYGSVAALFGPGVFSILISLVKPERFDWREFLRIELVDEAAATADAADDSNRDLALVGAPGHETVGLGEIKPDGHVDIGGDIEHCSGPPSNAGEKHPASTRRSVDGSGSDDPQKEPVLEARTVPTVTAMPLDQLNHPFSDATLAHLRRWYVIAWVMFITLLLLTFVLWPMPLYRNYIFTKSFFAGWTTVAIIWQFVAFGLVVVFPLYDGRHQIARGVRGLVHSTDEYYGRLRSRSRAAGSER